MEIAPWIYCTEVPVDPVETFISKRLLLVSAVYFGAPYFHDGQTTVVIRGPGQSLSGVNIALKSFVSLEISDWIGWIPSEVSWEKFKN